MNCDSVALCDVDVSLYPGRHLNASTNFGDSRIAPGGLGRSTSEGNFQSYNASSPDNCAASADLISHVLPNGNGSHMDLSEGCDKFTEWQTRARQAMDAEIHSPALLAVEDHAMTNEERQAFTRQSEERRISMQYGGPDVRLSMDSLQRPFGSCIEDETNRTANSQVNIPSPAAPGQSALRPIMMYSESLAAASNLHSDSWPGAVPGTFYHGLSYENQFNPPPPPPISGTSAFDSALYNRSLYFEQLVLKEPAETAMEESTYERVSPRTSREHRYYDVPDYPTTIASCSNRSHLHQDLAHAASQEDEMEEENTIRAWLDELEERVAYRRKECTYRIACQRAFIKQMKDKLLAR